MSNYVLAAKVLNANWHPRYATTPTTPAYVHAAKHAKYETMTVDLEPKLYACINVDSHKLVKLLAVFLYMTLSIQGMYAGIERHIMSVTYSQDDYTDTAIKYKVAKWD